MRPEKGLHRVLVEIYQILCVLHCKIRMKTKNKKQKNNKKVYSSLYDF